MAVYGNPLGSGLGAERRAYLDKMLLENTAQKTMFDRLATLTKISQTISMRTLLVMIHQ